MEEESKTFLQVKLAGKDKNLWSKLMPNFLLKIEKLLDTVINTEDNTTIRDEAKLFSNELIKFAKQKLKKAGYENEKILAEIEEIYSKAHRDHAETRKINAEAREIELRNQLTELKLSLGLMKALRTGENDEESILFLKQVDVFFEVVNTFELK
jgi:polyhydroxyalkanoate synthesis regulator phasin